MINSLDGFSEKCCAVLTVPNTCVACGVNFKRWCVDSVFALNIVPEFSVKRINIPSSLRWDLSFFTLKKRHNVLSGSYSLLTCRWLTSEYQSGDTCCCSLGMRLWHLGLSMKGDWSPAEKAFAADMSPIHLLQKHVWRWQYSPSIVCRSKAPSEHWLEVAGSLAALGFISELFRPSRSDSLLLIGSVKENNLLHLSPVRWQPHLCTALNFEGERKYDVGMVLAACPVPGRCRCSPVWWWWWWWPHPG